MRTRKPQPCRYYSGRIGATQSTQSGYTERAGTARLSSDPRGNLTIVCTVSDARFAEALAAHIPANEFRMDMAATAVVVPYLYAQTARAGGALLRRH